MNLKTRAFNKDLAAATQSDVGEGEHDRRDYSSRKILVTGLSARFVFMLLVQLSLMDDLGFEFSQQVVPFGIRRCSRYEDLAIVLRRPVEAAANTCRS